MSRRTRTAALAATALLALAALSTAPAAAAAPASGTGTPVLAGPGDPHLAYAGHWGHTAGHAITVNSGSELRFDFTGTTLHALFDTSSITNPSQIYVTIDGGARTLYKVDRDDIDLTPTALPPGRHRADVIVKDVDEYANRWNPPLQSGVVLTGLRLDPGAHLEGRPHAGRLRLEFYGDSITEGVMALCPTLGVDCADGTRDYAHLTGEAFRADTDQVGFGKQGLLQPGHGNVGTASQSFGWNYAGSPAAGFHPDAVVVNEGTNDGPYSSDQFRPAYLAYLRQIRAADPHAWIFAMRPFGGFHADDIAWAVSRLDDPKTVYVDTTGWLSVAAGDFNGTTHPNAQGHRKAAALLTAFVSATTGWRTTAATDDQ